MAVAIAVVPTHGKGKQRAYDDIEEDQQMEQMTNGDEDVTLILDPTRNEEQNSVARFCFGWAFGQEFTNGVPGEKGESGAGETEQDEEAECVYLESDGKFDGDTVSLATQTICVTALELTPAHVCSFKKRTALRASPVRLSCGHYERRWRSILSIRLRITTHKRTYSTLCSDMGMWIGRPSHMSCIVGLVSCCDILLQCIGFSSTFFKNPMGGPRIPLPIL